MARGFLERNITFWGMVGGVMTALKLKDRLDDCEFGTVYSLGSVV